MGREMFRFGAGFCRFVSMLLLKWWAESMQSFDACSFLMHGEWVFPKIVVPPNHPF